MGNDTVGEIYGSDMRDLVQIRLRVLCGGPLWLGAAAVGGVLENRITNAFDVFAVLEGEQAVSVLSERYRGDSIGLTVRVLTRWSV